MTIEPLDAGYRADLGTAPWALALNRAQAEHWSQKRRKDTRCDHGNTQECSEAGKAQHCADDQQHGHHEHTEEQTAECSLCRRFLCYG